MRTVRDIPVLENIPVLVRMGQAINSVRVLGALPTITYLRDHGARVILASHASGENPNTGIGTETLKPMYDALKKYLPNLSFCPVSVGPEARAAVRDLPPGGILLLENLRRNAGEVKNTQSFAEELAELADVFVQDAFDNCHRAHASMVGVPKLLPSYAGFLVLKEVEQLSKALKPKSPSLAVICGVKFTTKEPLIKKLLSEYDQVFVGGALANDFIKAAGHPVGSSTVSDANTESVKMLLGNPRLLLPIDAIVAPKGGTRNVGHVAGLDDVKDDEAVLDAGPQTEAFLKERVQGAKMVLWNGPLGNFENGFTDATNALAQCIADSSAYSIVGGGDTIVAIDTLNASQHFSFISTGGGAMLDFLAYGTLPGIAALEKIPEGS